MTKRLIIADDHEVVRQGIRELIAPACDMTIVAEAADGVEADRLARETPADLIILDIGLPDYNGIDILKSLRTNGIALPVLFFTMYPQLQYRNFARNSGANGFIGKDSSGDRLLRAIRIILAGGTFFIDSAPVKSMQSIDKDPFLALSGRETEVMRGLLNGISLQNIAMDLHINIKSISTYRARILAKLNIESNVKLVRMAVKYNYF